MLTKLIDKIREDEAKCEKYRELFSEIKISPKTILLHEGEVSKHIHFIKKGCLRTWFNKDGKDITTQFFFEGQAVASIESFISMQPSMFTIESIEPCVIITISKATFEKLGQDYPKFKEGFQEIFYKRFCHYARLFLSRIKDTPQERYVDLVNNHPDIIRRIPQHYIASYLGITPISLSRIRNRKKT